MANGCSYSDLFIFPNLKKLSAKEAMTKEWYVGCKFYDPIHKEKYPKGYFWRRKGLAEFKKLFPDFTIKTTECYIIASIQELLSRKI